MGTTTRMHVMYLNTQKTTFGVMERTVLSSRQK